MWRKLMKRFHPEGIPWPGTVFYNRLSRTLIFRDHYRRVAEDIAARCPPGSLVDIGTGPGGLLEALHARRPDLKLTGVDISPGMVAQARQNMARAGLADVVDIRQAAAGRLPFADALVDTVVSTGSIHHWKDVPAGLREVYRVLRPGGLGLMYDLVADTPPEVMRDLARTYGRVRQTLLWLHSFEEPFQTVKDFQSLAAQTPFITGQVQFIGAFCRLELAKPAPAG
ncbi:MAG: class I SAM-dependent methyltransferase [Planctomycetes bacterium]|nr:class I SAM-dependent methyltransferase [Planctomycetota bacterium]